ncbi:protocatechuate 3,4-dioxygenase alpha subunit [Microbacterium endophyticum]|uniref:Protocatechuate 3,4-dioxygenase alpha subunit n=1 Tax=Microbacterium endophyticum TaxID=1526412 RepID=A0A7W4YM09_9MICO|nr:protocatechuate 3,4-dioxygenase subunit alpha [Microbacterium endophyticum]MBB2975713.1 protocatechuate 3,4-dioxygenase alpha subunit [Microbacterium endophyticum]NIK36196.1 protocatechuate 3,4-dioxygenase alpha subunit [Microbacterium endophyticum]
MVQITPPAGDKVIEPSPGQTVGPFFAFGLIYPDMHEVAFPHSKGAIVVGGTVFDGAGAAIPDAVIEIWGADEDGQISRERGAFRRDDHTFTGFGRAATTDDGHYEFWTRNPGSVAGEAPFYSVVVFARGLPDKLVTRIYLPEDEDRLAADPLLASLSPEERATLIATRTPAGYLQHDIHLQGEKETVFLAF